MTPNIVSHFARAGLDLRLADAPFARGVNAADIFQLDIRRLRAHDVRSEHFLAWAGGRDNLAAVASADKKEQQLVLLVREGATEFEEAIPRGIVRAAPGPVGSLAWKQAIAAVARVPVDSIVARTGGASVVRSTKGTLRHMLVGRDERQLFMCELPEPCTTVRQAHDALRSPGARRAERSRSALDRPIRQGEWFFVIPTPWEVEDLDRRVGNNSAIVWRKTGISRFIPRAGKPHIVDEIVAILGEPGNAQNLRVYVRGAVRHPDHKTIHIRGWRRVFRNLEVDQNRSPFGGTWVD